MSGYVYSVFRHQEERQGRNEENIKLLIYLILEKNKKIRFIFILNLCKY